MKKAITIIFLLISFSIIAQNPCQDGTIIINGQATDAVFIENTNNTGLNLPLWLKAGTTLAAGDRVHFISVIEFDEVTLNNSTSLGYSTVLQVGTQTETVPAGKVWKVEAIVKHANAFASGFTASSNSPVCQGSTLNLSATTVAGATYSWTGPNGFTSNVQNPVINNVSQAAAGTYSMTATLNGCTSSASTTNVVVNSLPVSTFSNSPSLIISNSNTTFTPTLSGASYSWTFDQGTPASSTAINPIVQWSNAGNYDVTLTVTDNNGCTSTTQQAVTASNCVPGQPSSAFTWSPTNPEQGETVTFTPSVSGATYDWTFSGGTISSSTDENPQLEWSIGGSFDVSLTVSSAGCFTVTNNTINVKNSITYNFTGSTETLVVPSGVNSITIEAWGAQGGSTTSGSGGIGGLGAYMKGTFNVTQGDILTIGVGQQPAIHSNSGGGGGSSGVKKGSTILIVAGGGGGAGYSSNSNTYQNTSNAVTTTNGQNVYGCSSGTSLVSSGGSNGNGGGAGTNPCSDWPQGSGGAGINSNGGNGDSGSGGLSSGSGGSAGHGSAGGYGLTGGGGASYGGGGGGGYSGGGGGASAEKYTIGGGGGSYNSGTNQTNTAGANSGHGKVIITY